MSPVFAKQADSTKLAPTKGQKLVDLIGTVTLDDLGLFNWGTKDKAEINRALVELVGCQKVDPADPLQSELDPRLGTGGAIYLPKPWTPSGPLAVDKTHTFKLKKRLPMTAVAITELTPWFKPNDATKCTTKYRLEGLAARADKTDFEVHVARYRDRQGKSESSYFEVKKTHRETEPSRLGAADNPMERNEVPCATDGADGTHIWRVPKTGVSPSPEVTMLWDGESTATHGELKPGGAKAYINSTFAPYSVLVRYYKNDDDKVAKITFDESFYPRWKVEAGGTRKLDPTSLVVRWSVKHGPKEKLVHGQLQVFANGKATPVFQVGLDKTKLKKDSNELDLAGLWPESEIKRDELPYRVQIQAHSGPDEAEGLAIAVMPTQVRAYDYKRVQYLAFNVKPPSPYGGNPDHDLDIAARCNAMIEAVQKAKAKSNAAEDILKIFMAPEFYFRGPEGAYPVEKIETIMPLLRAEADKIEYKDWMFVFGSAIGYQKHEEAGAIHVHRTPVHDFTLSDITPTSVTVTPPLGKAEAIIPLADWWLVQPGEAGMVTGVTEIDKYKKYSLTFAPGPMFSDGAGTIEVPAMDVIDVDPPLDPTPTRILVRGRICEQIPSTTVAGRCWGVTQGAASRWIDACERNGTTADEFWLTLQTPDAFGPGPVELHEPISTEITNVALVQKGYQSPHMGDGGLTHAGIYKEYISHIDFARDRNLAWSTADGSGRAITVHGDADRPVTPIFGSVDVGGAFPNVKRSAPTETVGSEINLTGIGGGVVYTMYDITFGLEVCLDHAKNRLWDFYFGADKQAVAGDPTVQILLIPSWGMSIGGGKNCWPATTGTAFNVDGSRGDALARLNDGTTWCDKHPRKAGTLGAPCPEKQRSYICPTCHFRSTSPGNCIAHPATPLAPYVTCNGPKRACNFGCPIDPRCAHKPKTRAVSVCTSCRKSHRTGAACGCSTPNPQPTVARCGFFYPEGGPCPHCNSTVHLTCAEKFKVLGTPLAVVGTAEHVPLAAQPYFTDAGSVLAFPPVALPLPDIVV